MHDCDLAIVGSGFGGSLLAMVARRIGLRVMLLERGSHPRFAIGESASPLAGVLIQQLAERYDLPRLEPLACYGAWKRTYPQIGCGLKRGFTYFKHEAGQAYRANSGRTNQLMVAASPSDELSDTHWLRADVDHFLVNEAAALGADYVDHVSLQWMEWAADGSAVLTGLRDGQPLRIRARAVVDASGPRGFLSRALSLRPVAFDQFPATQALYSHFTGVTRCDAMPEYACAGTPPYPIDDAALHHVFDGGWMWVLRFDDDVTSAGVAVLDHVAEELGLREGAAAWPRLLARYPSIEAQFAGATPVREFTWLPRLSSRVSAAAGDRWALLPSAAAFVDPLFSTGMPLTLLGVERLGRLLEQGTLISGCSNSCGASGGDSGGRNSGGGIDGNSGRDAAAYSRVTLAEADHTARFIGGCYAAFARFDDFTAYSMFYFAAASYAEMSRRLTKAGADRPLREEFLRLNDGSFAQALARLSPCEAVRARAAAHEVRLKADTTYDTAVRLKADPTDEGTVRLKPDTTCKAADATVRLKADRTYDTADTTYEQRVAAAVAHINIAGLCDAAKHNWYDVDVEETIAAAAKLGASAAEVRELFARQGILVPTTSAPA